MLRSLIVFGSLLLTVPVPGATQQGVGQQTTPAPAQPAQDVLFRTSWQPIDAAARLEVGADGIQLALDDAIAIALQRNLGLRIERFERAQALFRIQQNLGIYDVLVTADARAAENTTPAASALEGAQINESESQSLNLGIDQLNPYGGTAGIDWTNSRQESNNRFVTVNPRFDIGFDLVYSQPLLRNFGPAVTNRNLRVARINSEISVENLEEAISGTIRQVVNAYWSLVENLAQLEVAEESLELAKQLHEMNRVQVDVGTKAPLELVQSEVGIATRQEEIIRVRASADDAADLLRQLLNLEDDRLWSTPLVPTTDPEIARIDIDLEEAIRVAYLERPEIRAQRLIQETLELDQVVARNQVLPRLDLQVRYGFEGLGGDVAASDDPFDPFDPNPEVTIVPGGYSDAADQITNMDFDGWQVLLNFAYPIQNRQARAVHTIAKLAVEQGETQIDQVELQIRTDVRQAARAVETAAQQIDSARISRELAERNLEAEQKKYENGISSSFQVLEIQEDLSSARSREVNSITSYRRALAQYYQAMGELLEESGVTIEDSDELDELQP